VAHLADRMAVMYRGRICEEGPTDLVLAPPWHPYTEALLAAVPQLDRPRDLPPPLLACEPAGALGERSGCPFPHPPPPLLPPAPPQGSATAVRTQSPAVAGAAPRLAHRLPPGVCRTGGGRARGSRRRRVRWARSSRARSIAFWRLGRTRCSTCCRRW